MERKTRVTLLLHSSMTDEVAILLPRFEFEALASQNSAPRRIISVPKQMENHTLILPMIGGMIPYLLKNILLSLK